MPANEELPSTLQRSPKKARETWSKAHDSAVREYGEGQRAHRTAFAALKHSFEKVGDHWEPKGRKGPSDAQASRSAPSSRKSRPDRSRSGRQRVQGTSDGRCEEARRQRPFADDEGRARQRHQEGQREEDGEVPPALSVVIDAGCSVSCPRS